MINRKDFEHNMHIAKEQIQLGRVHFSEKNKRTINGLVNARYAPNRRVNLHTVDEMARSMANTIASMSNDLIKDNKKTQ